jgi:hypothetical protein
MKPSLQAVMIVLLLTAEMACSGQVHAEACPPPGWSKSLLVELGKRDFSIDDDTLRNDLARDLQACLRSPDPALRDGVAFAAYAKWLRSSQLTAATRISLLDAQLAVLEGADDPTGFARPFAALVLAELARADAMKQELTPAQRSRLLASAVGYLGTVSDYRGFDASEGWRHGVAHGADLLMQLSRHPALGHAELLPMLDAVAAKIAPAGEHSYVFGEPERLARPIIFLALRDIFDEPVWHQWFERISSPKPFAGWNEVFATQSGLAKRHNTKGFLLGLYVAAQEADKPGLRRLLTPLRQALQRVD